MTKFFCDDDGNLSMGRLLAFLAAVNSIVVFNVMAFTRVEDLGPNAANIIIWTLGIAITGKAVSKVGENIKKK